MSSYPPPGLDERDTLIVKEFNIIQNHIIYSLNKKYNASKYFREKNLKDCTWKNKRLSVRFKFMYIYSFYEVMCKIHEENNIIYPDEIKQVIKSIKIRKVKENFM